ncbi:hypothetical protein [Paenibacillus sp. UASWS1643]|uniref:hypothetical protein n=1 Tax=Paenibacillus sp. UASWS1643 TaxID=2580422 RepID=UPI00398BE3B4
MNCFIKKMLPEENVAHTNGSRQDNGRIRISQVKHVDHQNVQRNQRHLCRNHHGPQQRPEHRLTPRKLQFGERISRQGGEEYICYGQNDRDEQRIV